MSTSTVLDVRWPIGGLFTALGLLVGGYGLATAGNAALYARSQSVNINLWWGLIMLVFGLLLLLSARRGGARLSPRPAELSPEGRAIEAREHRLGLEDDSQGG